jgi:hypothetical protein
VFWRLFIHSNGLITILWNEAASPFLRIYAETGRADFDVFKEKVRKVADHYFHQRFGKYGMTGSHDLQPLSRVYLYSGFGFDMAKTGDIRNVYIFSFLALAVILIAIFNFINLVTAQSEKRMREIGIRKVMGAFRKDLIFQFIGESVLISMFALLLSLMLNELFVNGFLVIAGCTIPIGVLA